MLDFLLVFPLRFPTVFTYPIEINAAVVAWAVLMVAAAFAAARVGEVPAGLRIAAGLFTWASVLLVPSSVFLLALPLLWLACRAPCGDASGGPDAYARLLIPALAVAEALQAYPVAGTQVSLAAVGMVPAGAIMLRDGLAQLRGSTAWLVALPAAVNLAAAAATGLTILTSFDAAEPLRLPGAESVRVDPSQAATLRAIVGSVSAHDCTFVVTYPGMGSMYLWTGRESSTEMRYVLWYVTLTADEQAALARQLRDRSGVCVIKNQRLIDFWTSGRPPPSGPLVDFIDSSFVRASSDGDYDLLVRAGS